MAGSRSAATDAPVSDGGRPGVSAGGRILNRRRVLGLGLAAAGAAGVGLTGCAPPTPLRVNAQARIPKSETKVTLTYWAWLKDLQKVCDIWNADHPDIHVHAVPIASGNDGGYQKMFSAVAGGGGPDIGQVETREVPQFLAMNALVNLSRYGADRHRSDFDPTQWGQLSFDKQLYGVPQDSGPVGFFYQPALLKKVHADPPKTWDEWYDTATEMRRRDMYLEAFSPEDATPFIAYATQAGAVWFKTHGDTWVVNMTDDATLTVCRFLDKALSKGLYNTRFPPLSSGWNAALARGKIAADTNGSWADALIETVPGGKGKWKVALPPRWKSGYGSTLMGGSSSAVMSTSKHPKEALEFLLWLNGSRTGVNALIDHSGIGWSTMRDYIGKARKKPSSFFSGENYNETVFKPANQEQNPNWTWPPITQRMFSILQNILQDKVNNGRSLVDGISDAQRQIVAKMKDMGLSVKAVK
jgi:multiple sugar transport system substrate-binding protein